MGGEQGVVAGARPEVLPALVGQAPKKNILNSVRTS